MFNNFIPQSKSQFNVGVNISYLDANINKEIVSHNWISNNLYIGAMLSSNSYDNIGINYNLNIGYHTLLGNPLNIIYDFSINSKRLIVDDIREKWKKISIIFNIQDKAAITYNYIVSKCTTQNVADDIDNCHNTNDSKNTFYFNFDIFNKINKYYIFNIGIKKIKTNLFPYISLRYIL